MKIAWEVLKIAWFPFRIYKLDIVDFFRAITINNFYEIYENKLFPSIPLQIDVADKQYIHQLK